VGTEVTISGMNFSATVSENSVTFNGVEATIQSATVDELITKVPMGATDGPIEVTVKQKSVTGPNFDVITEGALKVSTNTSGTMPDSDGYRLRINQNWEYSINANDERIFSSFSQDQYSLKISDVANNCFVENENPRSFSIIAGDTTSVALEINCKKALRDKIVFTSNPDLPNGDRDIYVINPDGSNQQKLFDTPEMEDFPEISNSGTRVVFRQTNSSDNNLYIADVDGSGLQQITNLPNFAFTASWSPDDSQIIFSNGTEEDAEIYVVNSDGTNLTQLTDDTAWNRYPEWSPDGSKIVFDSNIDGDFEIYTMNPDGSNVEKLTNDSYRNSTAKWSPDGSELIFESTRDGNLGDIYRMNADGTNVRRITTNNGGASAPDWSPDGSRIVFEDNRDLFIINSDGSGSSSQITNNPNPNSNQIGIADWSTN
jgi:Tol biopolymer transport system component